MQISGAVKLFFAAALSLAATVSASECTSIQEEQIQTALGLIGSSSACASSASDDGGCDSACVQFVSSIVDEFPDCDYSGVNYYSYYTKILSKCDDDNAATGVMSTDATLVCLSGVAAAALALAGGN